MKSRLVALCNRAICNEPKRISGAVLLRDHAPRCRRRLTGRGRRNRECQPGVLAVGPVFSGEFLVAFDIDIALKFLAERKDIADLRPDTGHARLKTADAITGPAVAGNLIVEIADQTDL